MFWVSEAVESALIEEVVWEARRPSSLAYSWISHMPNSQWAILYLSYLAYERTKADEVSLCEKQLNL